MYMYDYIRQHLPFAGAFGVGSLVITGPVACKGGIITVISRASERFKVAYSNMDLLEESFKCFIDIATILCTHFIE